MEKYEILFSLLVSYWPYWVSYTVGSHQHCSFLTFKIIWGALSQYFNPTLDFHSKQNELTQKTIKKKEKFSILSLFFHFYHFHLPLSSIVWYWELIKTWDVSNLLQTQSSNRWGIGVNNLKLTQFWTRFNATNEDRNVLNEDLLV